MYWQATVTWTAAEVEDVEGAMDALCDALAAQQGAVGAPDERGRWSVTLTVEAGTLRRATATALRVVADALLNLAPWSRVVLVSVEVLDDEEADRRVVAPPVPDLVSTTEAARILGVSRQRVGQLAESDPVFPVVAARVNGASVWVRAAVERYAALRDATPGRHRSARSA